MRKALPEVRHGTYREFCKGSSRLYLYAREYQGQRLLVVCAFSDVPTVFRAPRGFDLSRAELLLGNYPPSGSLILRPWETRVYRWAAP